MALRIKGKGSVFQDVPVPGRLSAALLEWKALQEAFKGRRILRHGGITFAGVRGWKVSAEKRSPTLGVPSAKAQSLALHLDICGRPSLR